MPNVATISIYADDLDAATEFYTRQLGFTVKSRPAPVIVELDHDGVAIVLCKAEKRTRQDYPDGTGTVVGLVSRDVVADAGRLAAAHAELVIGEPQEFPGGRFIAVRDPAGNVIELLEFAR